MQSQSNLEMPVTLSELWNRALIRRQVNVALPPPPLQSQSVPEEPMDLHGEVAALLAEDGDNALSELLSDMAGPCAPAPLLSPASSRHDILDCLEAPE